MASRAVLLIVFAVFLISSVAYGDATQQLPSRKASVVFPLLKKFSSKEGYDRIIQILGKEDFDIGNAYRECVFRLDHSPIIMVKASLDGKKVYFIEHGNEMLYTAPLK
jgi:hypothetical protein